MAHVVTLLGASGLIGGELVKLLCDDQRFSTIHLPVRRSLHINHAKVKEWITDFSDDRVLDQCIRESNIVFSALGTTMKQVKGDRKAYQKVDFDIPLAAAKLASTYNLESFLFVSSVGANASNDNNFYLKLKGVTEEAIAKLSIHAIHIMRPSLLIGQREEFRLGERISQAIFPAVSVLLGGKLRKYKSVKASSVAAAMIRLSQDARKGVYIHHYDEITQYAKEYGAKQ
jgi:uncharacterized protein YbjT (DUF2867 family)